MSGTIISARNGRRGIEVPDAWAHDTYGDEVYWLECDGCRGSVIVDYYAITMTTGTPTCCNLTRHSGT